MFGWLLFGTMTDFFSKPSGLPKEILTPYHKKKKQQNKRKNDETYNYSMGNKRYR